MDFRDRVVVATGGGSGITKAAVEGFVTRGAKVLVGDLNVDALEGMEGVRGVQTDLLEDGAPAALANLALAEHGRIDVLVNGVGAAVAKEDFLETTEESWNWHIQLNLMTAVRMSKAALPSMVEAGRGSVVSISSSAGRFPIPFFSEYSAAKGGLISWSKALAGVYSPKGIRFNTVAPGPTRTPSFMRTFEEELAPAWGVSVEEAVERFVKEQRMPISRLAEPEEVAAAILFLASDAASMITGLEIRVDGGQAPVA